MYPYQMRTSKAFCPFIIIIIKLFMTPFLSTETFTDSYNSGYESYGN
jgi:hypothetical protein